MDGQQEGTRERRRRREITQEVAARIVDHIEAEQLSTGAHMSAQHLADRLSVSRSPVTQALRLLSEKGLVVHEPNRGFFLTGARGGSPKELGLSGHDELRDVYFRIAEDRLRGALEDQVSETHLRERYGLTRGELATLLNRISREGWAERRRGYGWTFSAILTTPEALDQTYRLRMALEPNALLEPSFHLPRREAAKWRRVEERLLAGEIDTLSADELHDKGVDFHEALATASGNPFFLEALKRVNRVRRLLSYRSMIDRSRYYSQAAQHLEILDLVERGRQEEAAEAMRVHLQSVVNNLKKIRRLLEPEA
ncbi:GntR family transcriptional regulator [Lutibaculum baratangense]|nr:GntR family transcriptional regulator [Lutibaculum baratangense]